MYIQTHLIIPYFAVKTTKILLLMVRIYYWKNDDLPSDINLIGKEM